MSARTIDIISNVTVIPTDGYRFRSEGVTCFTLCDGFVFGSKVSNGRRTDFNFRALDVGREVIRRASVQERRLLVAEAIRSADEQEKAQLRKLLEDGAG